MSEADYEAAVAAFLKKKGVTRCPTVCVVPDPGDRRRGRPRSLPQLCGGKRSRAA